MGNESDARKAASRKGKGKVTAVDDVDDGSEITKEAKRKGKKRAAKPDGEEGYQTDGDVLRSGHSETPALPKRRTPSPKYRPRIRARPVRRKATAPTIDPNQRPVAINPIHGRTMPEWEIKLISGKGNAPTVTDDDEGWSFMQVR